MREQEQANRLYAVATHAVDIRHVTGAVPIARDRLVFRGRAFSIGSVVNVDEQDWHMTLLVSELPDAADC